MKFLHLLALPLLAACGAAPQAYQAQTPKMDFVTYFSGTTYGYGAIYGFTGKVTDRFTVIIKGTPGTNASGRRTLSIAEDFAYTSGKTQKRTWDVVEPTPGILHGKAPDVPGLAEGLESGNALKFTYPITITRDNGKQVTLSSTDWMWMLTPDILLNRNSLSKFGIPVAELVITFTKQPPAR